MDNIGEHPEMGVGERIFDRRCEVVGEEDGEIELDDPSVGGLPSVERLSLAVDDRSILLDDGSGREGPWRRLCVRVLTVRHLVVALSVGVVGRSSAAISTKREPERYNDVAPLQVWK